jgi:hypothetical protein
MKVGSQRPWPVRNFIAGESSSLFRPKNRHLLANDDHLAPGYRRNGDPGVSTVPQLIQM